jgi:hypothetical protein
MFALRAPWRARSVGSVRIFRWASTTNFGAAWLPVDQLLSVLDYRYRRGDLYRRHDRNPAFHARVIDAIFDNPELMGRFSPREQRHLRRVAEATANWIIACECIRHDDWATGSPIPREVVAEQIPL